MPRLTRAAAPLASGVALTLLSLHTPPVAAQQTCGVHSFGTSAGDPLAPDAPGWLLQSQGSSIIYGTTPSGGAYNRGTVFQFTPEAEMRVVHSFDGVAGNQARGGLTHDGDGVFYGVTYGGGERKVGTIFATVPGGKPSVVFSFKNGFIPPLGRPPTEQEILDAAGSYPIAPPVLAPDGNLYGVTSYAFNQKKGALYRLAGDVYQGLYVFDGTAGSFPSTLTAGTDGNLYGVAQFGRNGNPYGLIFKANIDGGGVSVLYEFDRTHGGYPFSILYGIDGNLYGTTAGGGLGKAAGMGVVYKLTPAGEITVLHQFNGADGWGAFGGLIEASDGYLYGTTRAGGGGRGTIFRIRPDGSDFERLHSFSLYQTGRLPIGSLVEYPEGTFYGVTSRGGARDYGMLYRLVMPRPGQPEYAKRGVSMLFRPDQYVDLRRGVEATQRDLATQIVTPLRDAVALEVKCGCGHVVQFVQRQFFGDDGLAKDRTVTTSWGSYSTTVEDAIWMPDSMSKNVSEFGKRTPYYESSMAFRTDPDLLTIFDAPNFSASVYPGPGERSIATFKSFAICHNQIVREIDWWHEKQDANDPVYGANPPTRPDMQKWQTVFRPLLVEHGYDVSELP